MTLLYKTTHPDGTPWHRPSQRIVYEAGCTYRATGKGRTLCTDGLLHAARLPEQAALPVASWPYILWQVTGRVVAEDAEKVGLRHLTVVGQLPEHLCWGPNGVAVEGVVRRAGRLTVDEMDRLYAAWVTSRAAAAAAAWAAAWDAADAARAAAAAARVTAWVTALVGRHGLIQSHIDMMLGPWRSVIGNPLIDPVCECGVTA